MRLETNKRSIDGDVTGERHIVFCTSSLGWRGGGDFGIYIYIYIYEDNTIPAPKVTGQSYALCMIPPELAPYPWQKFILTLPICEASSCGNFSNEDVSSTRNLTVLSTNQILVDSGWVQTARPRRLLSSDIRLINGPDFVLLLLTG